MHRFSSTAIIFIKTIKNQQWIQWTACLIELLRAYKLAHKSVSRILSFEYNRRPAVRRSAHQLHPEQVLSAWLSPRCSLHFRSLCPQYVYSNGDISSYNRGDLYEFPKIAPWLCCITASSHCLPYSWTSQPLSCQTGLSPPAMAI